MMSMETSEEVPPPASPSKTSPNKNAKPQSGKRQKPPSSKTGAGANKFHCPTCNVRCPNEPSLQQHNSSIKHNANLANLQRRDKHAMSSIFVGNLPKLAQITSSLPAQEGEDAASTVRRANEKLRADLTAMFSVYGDVSKLIVDKKHGSYCIVEYKAPAMAQVVLAEYAAGKVPLFYSKKVQIKSRKVTEIQPLSNISSHNEIQVSSSSSVKLWCVTLEYFEMKSDFKHCRGYNMN